MNADVSPLKLVNPWDRFAWERWAQDEGLLATLTRSEANILWIMVRAADHRGMSYWGNPKTAKAAGVTVRTVRRTRRRLEQLGLIELIREGGKHERDTSVYRVVPQYPSSKKEPVAANPVMRDRSHATTSSAKPTALKLADNDKCPGGGGHGRPGGEDTRVRGWRTPASPKKPSEKPKEKPNSIASKLGPHPPASMFDSPDATAAAAAAELVAFGFSKAAAWGIVREHRPTAEQVRIVLDNTRAWLEADRRGETRRRLENPEGFVKSQIRAGAFNLDSRAQRMREASNKAKDAAKRAATKQVAQRKEIEQANQIECDWQAIPPTDRQRFTLAAADELEQAGGFRAKMGHRLRKAAETDQLGTLQIHQVMDYIRRNARLDAK